MFSAITVDDKLIILRDFIYWDDCSLIGYKYVSTQSFVIKRFDLAISSNIFYIRVFF